MVKFAAWAPFAAALVAGCGSCGGCGDGAPSGPPPAAQTTAEKTHTCPMHPDVVRSAPGNCPKCGMALVPK